MAKVVITFEDKAPSTEDNLWNRDSVRVLVEMDPKIDFKTIGDSATKAQQFAFAALEAVTKLGEDVQLVSIQ